MRGLVLLRWELAQTIRGTAMFAALTIVALVSAAIVGAGMITVSLWSPFAAITPTFPGRTDNANAPTLLPIVGEFRGGVAFFLILAWILLVAATLAPALTAGMVVRDRRSGRFDRLLTDASRAGLVTVVKWLGILLPLGLILLAAAPAASFAWLVGGLPSSQALASAAVAVVIVATVASVALFCSVLARTEVVAMLASYLVISTLLFGPLLIGLGLVFGGFRQVGEALIGLAPFVALLSTQSDLTSKLVILIPADWPSPYLTWTIGGEAIPAWILVSVAYILIAVGFVWLTIVIVEPLHPLKTWRLRRVSETRV